jgi:hypothetical protein
MDGTTQATGSWTDTLLRGVNALIDSQAQKAYLTNVAKYNTQQGVAGQAQATATATAVLTSPAVLIAGALLLGAVVFLALRR